ncbi:thiol:disulfide interchange protein DsbA/DsbL [Ferrimonas aestuarii]|uniref:thiol:disulfide interchange protein DsbA/DsbL n=1 Tax=Ferrimonas aestuarii TaxID=2569539 RepID=UPI00145DB3E7|nr:thiol:disulfide interchange protein DsbA/DsbL [Ferrimonas aestuarii]
MLVRFITLITLLFTGLVNGAQFQEGVHYKVVNGLSESAPNVVREYFSYNCGHCKNFDPVLKVIMDEVGDAATLERTPVGFNRTSWQLSAKGYYLSEILGVTEQTHEAFFHQIHNLGQPFTTDSQLRNFFINHGISPMQYDAAAAGSELKMAISNGDSRASLAGLKGVPSVVVGGKYLIVNPGKTVKDYVALVKYLSTLP